MLTACEPPPAPVLTEIPKGSPIPVDKSCFIVSSPNSPQYETGTANAGDMKTNGSIAFFRELNQLNSSGTPYTIWCYPNPPALDPSLGTGFYLDWFNTNTLPPTPTEVCVYIDGDPSSCTPYLT
jgi:hypothetical protein